MVWLIRFLVGWITFIIVVILLFISRAICWDWNGNMQFEDLLGENTVDAMFFNKSE